MVSLLGKLLKRIVPTIKDTKTEEVIEKTSECMDILALKDEMEKLCEKHHYVARREYLHIFSKYQKTVDFFTVLANSKMLESFSERYQMNCHESFHAKREKQVVFRYM